MILKRKIGSRKRNEIRKWEVKIVKKSWSGLGKILNISALVQIIILCLSPRQKENDPLRQQKRKIRHSRSNKLTVYSQNDRNTKMKLETCNFISWDFLKAPKKFLIFF